MIYLNSALFFLSAILVIKDQIKYLPLKVILIFLLFVTSILLGAHYHIDLVSGDGIDESVVYFLNSEGSGAAHDAFFPVIGSFLFYFIITLLLSVVCYKLSHDSRETKNSLRLPRILVGIGLLCASLWMNPGLQDIIKLNQAVINSEENTISEPEHYKDPSKMLWPRMNKNLIYIYLESLEQTYLDESIFPGLMPNLQKLKREGLLFSNLSQVYGTGWTVAGMTASQCGIPLVTTSGGNSMSGVDEFLPRATCIGDILRKKHYSLNYIGGANIEFAGKGQFYKTHGFESVEGFKQLNHNLTDPAYKSSWGLYDDTLFGIAKKKFNSLSSQDNPFALFMLTLDTHSPHGHIPKSCEHLNYRDGSNPILNSVHCTDLLLADFISYLRNHEKYRDTLIAIGSDHLAMPNSARDLLEQGNRRNLFLILEKGITPNSIDKPGSILDISPTILHLLSRHQHQINKISDDEFGFGVSLISKKPTLMEKIKNVDNFLMKNKSYLSQLWGFPDLKEGIEVNESEDKIYLGNRSMKIPTLIQIGRNKQTIEKIFFPFHATKTLANQISNLKADQLFVWIDHCHNVNALVDIEPTEDSKRCLVAGSLNGKDLFSTNLKKGQKLSTDYLKSALESGSQNPHTSYASKNILTIKRFESFNTSNVFSMYYDDHINQAAIIRSAGFRTGHSYIRDASKEIDLTKKASRGLSMYSFSKNLEIKKVANIDSCDGRKLEKFDINQNLAKILNNERKKNKNLNFVIIAHDSAICGSRALEKIFHGLPLTRWNEISFRKPYIGLIDNTGREFEWIGKTNSAIAIELRIKSSNSAVRSEASR